MLELIPGFDETTIALRGRGTVTADDYRTVLMPAVERATAGGHKARLLLDLGEGFEGYDAGGLLADAEVGIGHLGSFDRIAIVTDTDWLRRAIHLFGGMIPGELRLFAAAEEAQAEDWIRS
ncbi:MAG TPA: STAS/SEC14 domain-containing protein [Candidatus Limnocylindria bacterium]|nr:STAS/SEC14 domain-containing protein [Candidatus Limnocylindria bacterium]